MKKILILFIVFAIAGSKLNAQTFVSGGIYNNTAWTLTNSPYIVTDTITLFPGVTLSIDPGVVVKFNNNVPLNVRGTINAVGTVTDSILFISNAPVPVQGSWHGVVLNTQLGAGANFDYCKVMHASTAIDIWCCGSNLINIHHTSFVNNRNGIAGYTLQNAVSADSCYFENNHSAVGNGSSSAYFTLTNSTVKNNTIGFDYTESLNATNCTFCGNGIALYVWNGSFNNCIIMNNGKGIVPANSNGITLMNSTVAQNDTGIVVMSLGSNNIHQNNICQNSFFNIVLQGPGNVDLSNNCWCDTVAANISQKIYDGYDNIALGLVSYMPFVVCDSTVLPENICSNLTGTFAIKENPNEIHLFPNPMYDYSTLKINKELRNAQITITNVMRQKVLNLVNQKGKEFVLYKRNLAGGLYFFSITEGGKIVYNQKLIIL